MKSIDYKSLSVDNLDGEVWKPIKGYESDCLVSSYGRVKYTSRIVVFQRKHYGTTHIARKKRNEHIISQRDNGRGYQIVRFGEKNHYVHRLVAMAFIDNPKNLPEVDHINGVREDNRVCNLRWTNRKGNMANPLTKEKCRMRNDSLRIPIIQLTISGDYIAEWPGVADAAEAMGCARATITSVLTHKGRSKAAKGFVFVYKHEYDPNKDYSVIYNRTIAATSEAISETSLVDIQDGLITKVFPSYVAAAKYYGITPHIIGVTISRIKKGCHVGEKKKSSFPKSLKQFRDLTDEQRKFVLDNLQSLSRRTAATIGVMRGHNIHALQRCTGHNDLSVFGKYIKDE